MNITPAYETICNIIVTNTNILTEEDLKKHLETIDLEYTEDDMYLAYNWACQAVKHVIEYKGYNNDL